MPLATPRRRLAARLPCSATRSAAAATPSGLTSARAPTRTATPRSFRSERSARGKTTLDQKLAYEAFLLGARVIDCDPKGDHRMHELPEVAPHVETIALRGERALRGMLDPLRIAPEHLRQDAAVSFLTDLLPARSEAAWEAAVASAVDAVCRRSADAHLPRGRSCARRRRRGRPRRSRRRSRSMPGRASRSWASPTPTCGCRRSARDRSPICRSATCRRRSRAAPRAEYSPLERVGEQIVRLIAMFAMALMAAERSRLKVFSFDEGWRLLGDPVGRMLLASLQRMGRSELAVPIISTQLVGDTLLDGRESLENLIGATFVFGLRSEREAERALALLDLDPDDRRLRDHAARVRRRTLPDARPSRPRRGGAGRGRSSRGCCAPSRRHRPRPLREAHGRARDTRGVGARRTRGRPRGPAAACGAGRCEPARVQRLREPVVHHTGAARRQLSATERRTARSRALRSRPSRSPTTPSTRHPVGPRRELQPGRRHGRPGPARHAGLDGARLARPRRPGRARVVLLARAPRARRRWRAPPASLGGAHARLHRPVAGARTGARSGRLRLAGPGAPPRPRHARAARRCSP